MEVQWLNQITAAGGTSPEFRETSGVNDPLLMSLITFSCVSGGSWSCACWVTVTPSFILIYCVDLPNLCLEGCRS